MMKTIMKSRLVLGCTVIASVLGQSPEDGIIRPGQPWFDTDGSRMYAGGMDMFKQGSTYYIIGEGNKTMQDCSECFNMYSTQDLETWKFEGCMLRNEDIRNAVFPPYDNVTAYPFYRMERPKVFKCPSTQKYVIWFHCDTSGFAISSVGVLTADKITGPYTFASHCFKPDGFGSYDMGTYYDDPLMPGGDGHMYLVRSVDNNYAGVSQMTDDCLNVTGVISAGPHMEAQAIMRDVNGQLHMVGSHETGWSANSALFVTSPNTSLNGAIWIDDYNPSGDGSTWDSQSTFLFPFEHADSNPSAPHITTIWMADRWNAYGPGALQNMTMIWLPLMPPSGPAPTAAKPGWTIQLTLCNSTDSNEQFQWHGNNTVTHTQSGLCITQPPDANGSTLLYVETCGATDGSQTWFKTGAAFSNTTNGFGLDCVNWNCGNGFELGGAVQLYRCGNQTQWNSRWDVPLTPDTSSVFQALSDSTPTGYCLSVSPLVNPSIWQLPWHDSWRLKDY